MGDVVSDKEMSKRCAEIADRVVYEYRHGLRSYSCTGTYAKRWNSAYQAAWIALGGSIRCDYGLGEVRHD